MKKLCFILCLIFLLLSQGVMGIESEDSIWKNIEIDSSRDDITLSKPVAGWSRKNGEYITSRNDAFIEFSFQGSGIRIYGSGGPNRGIVNIYLDNKKVKEVDLYREQKEKDLLLFSKRNLEENTHTIRIEATGSKNTDSTFAAMAFSSFSYIPTLQEVVDDTKKNLKMLAETEKFYENKIDSKNFVDEKQIKLIKNLLVEAEKALKKEKINQEKRKEWVKKMNEQNQKFKNIPVIIEVKDFGAKVDDGECDVKAINEAIAAASEKENATVVFEAGVYNLKKVFTKGTMIQIKDMENLTLKGETTEKGQPATIFIMNLELENEIDGAKHINIVDSQNIKVENIVLDHDPRFNTSGEIVEVNENEDTVTVDIFPGMSHFEGMKSFSANSWNLETGELLPVKALTIGVDEQSFQTWKKVSGYEKRYKIKGGGFSDRVKAGQGISWHFNVNAYQGNNIRIYNSNDVSLENVNIYSTLGMSVAAGYNENLTFKNVDIRPEGNSLAVGPRDGFHLYRNRGKLLMEDIYIKGVRWDPIVSYLQFIKVDDVIDENSIKISSDSVEDLLRSGDVSVNDRAIFWEGMKPFSLTINSINSSGLITFNETIPDTITADSMFTPGLWVWEEAVIRDSKIEGNYGTAIIYESENLVVENNIFNNNAYSNIGLGPTSSNAGGFARNVIIKNNQFINSTWDNKYGGSHSAHNGTITTFQNRPEFNREPYNENIVIENNLFKNLDKGDHVTAIHLKNAQNVEISNNEYINVKNKVRIDEQSTKDIIKPE